MIYRVTGEGLKPLLNRVIIQPKRSYYMGASSSPRRIYVTHVTDDIMTYKTVPIKPQSVEIRTEYHIAQDLIERACQRKLKDYKSLLETGDQSMREYFSSFVPAWIEELEEMLHGTLKPTPEDNYKTYKVEFALKGAGDLWQEVDDATGGSCAYMKNDGTRAWAYVTGLDTVHGLQNSETLQVVAFEHAE